MKPLQSFIDSHWRTLFAVSATIYTLSSFIEPYPLSGLIKIIPLMILTLFSVLNTQSNIPKLFIVGLLFSMCGDFILNIDHQQAFLYGLGSFFIAHLFYIICLGFWTFKKRLYSILAIIFAISGASSFLIFPQLGQLFVPVLAYMIILLIMSLSTVFSKKSNLWLIIGGISFMISDSIIGLNKFYMSIAFSNVLIMTSYYFAQYSLLNGFITTDLGKEK